MTRWQETRPIGAPRHRSTRSPVGAAGYHHNVPRTDLGALPLLNIISICPHPASPHLQSHLHLTPVIPTLIIAQTPQTQECLDKYQELKSGKKSTYIIYGLSDDKKNIVVLETSTDKDFDSFTAKLPEKDCRWVVYDFEFNLGSDGIRNKLAFIMWYVTLTLSGNHCLGVKRSGFSIEDHGGAVCSRRAMRAS